MTTGPHDFAVFGSSPMAMLIAGLLAANHKKRVCLVADDPAAFRLPRGIDLSVAPLTRPETWQLLRTTVPEITKLVTAIGGRGMFARIDPLMIAQSPAAVEALSHMRHTALGFDQAVERVTDSVPAGASAVYKMRDALTLSRAQLEPALIAWLTGLGVMLLPARASVVTVKRDGSARIDSGGQSFEAVQAVLVDSAAIIAHLDPDERDRTLAIGQSTAILTEPTKSLSAPVMIYADQKVILSQHSGGGVIGLSHGRADSAAIQIGGTLPDHGRLRRAGQMVFRTVRTRDCAPLLGPARGIKALVVAGFGLIGAFAAPAIARQLAGAASEFEQSYFAAREPGRGNSRQQVAEYGAETIEEVVA